MITKEQLRAFVATPKGKLAVACSCLALCWLFLLLYFFGDALTALGDPKSLARAKQELARQKVEYEKVRVRYDELQSQRKRYRRIVDAAWKESGEDQVKSKLHGSITALATKLEIKLSRINSVNIVPLNNDLYCAEVDIAADGKLDEIVNLIDAFDDLQPRPEWKQLVLRPDNRPRPQMTGIDSLNLANAMLNVERTPVSMAGTLRVICAKETVKNDKGKTSAK